MGTPPTLDPNTPGAIEIGNQQGLLSAAAIFILLRAFANGGSSLTGLEAIADGVGLFRSPKFQQEVNPQPLIPFQPVVGHQVVRVFQTPRKPL